MKPLLHPRTIGNLAFSLFVTLGLRLPMASADMLGAVQSWKQDGNAITFVCGKPIVRLEFWADDVVRVTAAGTGVDDSVLAIGYAYDTLGRREKVTSYNHTTAEEPINVLNQLQYAFNNLGLLEEEYQEHDGVVDGSLYVEYAYDTTAPAGIYTKGMRPKSVQYPDTTRTVYTLYLDAGGGSGIGDAISRVTALSAVDSRATEANVYAAFAYNGAGRLVMESQKSTVPTTVAELDYYGGAAGTYAGFDRFGRVVDQKWVHGATVLDRYGYGYDRNSNRTHRENVLAADRSEVYAYDMLDRLAGMDRGTLNEGKTAIAGTPAREEDWNLTQTGNWAGYDVAENGQAVLNQTRTNNKANEITGLSEPESQTQWVQPEYDARGNMIIVPKPNSPASAFTCTWDAWNRLIQVKDGETVVATYQYDGLNHRIVKTVGETIRHAYYNAGWQLLETRETTDPEAKPETLDPKTQYVWSVRYIDALILRDRDTDDDGDLDERLYFTNDANMNVTALLDTGGTVLERYAYTPYGKPSFFDASWNPRAESAYDNAILYCGYYFDDETGLYHVRFRPLHCHIGWIARDPIRDVALIVSALGDRHVFADVAHTAIDVAQKRTAHALYEDGASKDRLLLLQVSQIMQIGQQQAGVAYSAATPLHNSPPLEYSGGLSFYAYGDLRPTGARDPSGLFMFAIWNVAEMSYFCCDLEGAALGKCYCYVPKEGWNIVSLYAWMIYWIEPCCEASLRFRSEQPIQMTRYLEANMRTSMNNWKVHCSCW